MNAWLSVAMPRGIIAGQAWESEPSPIDVAHYLNLRRPICRRDHGWCHLVGGDAAEWRALGANMGAAYQLADDLMDAAGEAKESGKPVGQDSQNDRPNAVNILGIQGVIEKLKGLLRLLRSIC